MKFAVIESMTRIEVFGLAIRVWRNEKELREVYDNDDLKGVIARWGSQRDIAEKLAAMPRVNAVEVVDRVSGAGIVVYPTWP